MRMQKKERNVPRGQIPDGSEMQILMTEDIECSLAKTGPGWPASFEHVNEIAQFAASSYPARAG